jgi:hypothetical protein
MRTPGSGRRASGSGPCVTFVSKRQSEPEAREQARSPEPEARSRASTFLVLVLALLARAAPVSAQQPVQFLPRFDFHLGAEYLSDDDNRFVWDADLGGEVDVVGYGAGRVTFTTNYEVVMGTQLRRFDPNQGNYILAGSASARAAGFELAGMFYHQSRHLADRPKLGAVDWNMVGARIVRDVTRGRAAWQTRADVRGVIQKSFVDYRWELDAEARGRIALVPRVSLISTGGLRVLGVDGTRNRGNQAGFLAEGGVRFEGSVAAMEFFVAAERRIDPFPVEFGTVTWLKTGFRVLTR